MTRRNATSAGLALPTGVAVLTLAVVLLLRAVTTGDLAPGSRPGPRAEPPKVAVNVVVSTHEILVDGAPVVALETTTDGRGAEVPAIPASAKDGLVVRDLLGILRDHARDELGDRADAAFAGEVILQVDRRVPFRLLREVMFTAREARYAGFRFLVIEGG